MRSRNTEDSPTGADIALARCGVYRLGPANEYDPHLRRVILTRETARGTDLHARLSAMHECQHATQHNRWPWLMAARRYKLRGMPRRFQPVTWFLEAHASVTAIALLDLRGRERIRAVLIALRWLGSYL